MGLIRKTMSVSSAGVIKYRSNSEKKAIGARDQGKAAKREAKATERLARAEIEALKAQTSAAAASASAARSGADPSHIHEYVLGELNVIAGKSVYTATCRCGDEQRVLPG